MKLKIFILMVCLTVFLTACANENTSSDTLSDVSIDTSTQQVSSMEHSSSVEVESDISSEEIISSSSIAVISEETTPSSSMDVSSDLVSSVSEISTSNADVSSEELKSINGMPVGYIEKFTEYYKINSDVKGYLKIEGTNIDFPIPQAKNNNYYMQNNFSKQKDNWGFPSMTYNVRIEKENGSKNILITGTSDHKNGRYLADISKYRDVSFYKSHPIVQFDTVYKERKWKIITMFKENLSDLKNCFDYWNYIELDNPEKFNEYIGKVKERALYTTSVDALPTDDLLQIQVTTTNNFDDKDYYVLVCRAVREGEDASVDTSGAAQR